MQKAKSGLITTLTFILTHFPAQKVLLRVLTLSLIIFIWLASFYLAKSGAAALPKISGPIDLTTVISGTGTIAVGVFSILLGIASIYGLGSIESKIRTVVSEVTAERLDKIERESRGRSFAILGYVIGEMSVPQDFSPPISVERLREAIFYCGEGYKFLKDTGLPVEFMALNNFLEYSCALGEKTRRGYILEEAEHLRAAAVQRQSTNLLLTYARVILNFSLESKEIDAACLLVEDLRSTHRLDDKQKREAEHLASLCTKRRKLS